MIAPIALTHCSSRCCASAAADTDHVRRGRGAVRGLGRHGAAKAALEQASNVLAAEETAIRVCGSTRRPRMRMHQRRSPARTSPACVPGRGPGLRPAGHRAAARRATARGAGAGIITSMEFTLPADFQRRPAGSARPAQGRRAHAGQPRRPGDGRPSPVHRLPALLLPGYLLVVNTSRTLPAAVLAAPGLAIHFSTGLPDGNWLVEPRIPAGKSRSRTGPWHLPGSSPCPAARS